MAKRRSSASGFRTTAPKERTAIASVIIFVVGLISWAVPSTPISPYTVWIMAIAYILLLAGVVMKGL